MKKIFTSVICLGAALVASAQNFTVTGFGDTTFNDGDVVNVGYTINERGRYVWDPELTVNIENATSPFGSTVTVTAAADTPNIVQFCGIDGQCNMLTETALSKSKTYSAGTDIDLTIDISAKAEIIAEPIAVTLIITDGVQTTNLTVNFLTSEHAGIAAPEVAESALKVYGRTLHFNVESRANLTLYNISGRAMINRNVNHTGSISLEGLPAGVYVYRLGKETGKILVR